MTMQKPMTPATYESKTYDYSFGKRTARTFFLLVGISWFLLTAFVLIKFRNEVSGWLAFAAFGVIVSGIFIFTCAMLVRRQQRIGADDRGISARILGFKVKQIAWQEIEWIEIVEEFNPLPRHPGRGRQKRVFVMGAGRAIAFTDRIGDGEELHARCVGSRVPQPVRIIERLWNVKIGFGNGLRRALVLYRAYPGSDEL